MLMLVQMLVLLTINIVNILLAADGVWELVLALYEYSYDHHV